MKILHLHILRTMLGPFFFALAALTGIVFLNAIAQEMKDLSGKGLGWEVIGEVLLLTLPHTLALTLPMAVLVGVLHAFSEMTSANEITAMKAGGVSPSDILRPLLGAGLLAAATVYLFNDLILPDANHRLKDLLDDIRSKSPTLALREQTVNRLVIGEEGRVYNLIARDVENETSMLRDVIVVDQSDIRRRTTTWADSARIEFSSDLTDLYMTLYDGESVQTEERDRAVLDRSVFGSQQLRFEGVGDVFERGESPSTRGGRELPMVALLDRARSHDRARSERALAVRALTVDAVRGAIGHPMADTAMTSALELTGDRAARALDLVERTGMDGGPLSDTDQLTRHVRIETSGAVARSRTDMLNARAYRVEVHKRTALAFACIVFVILGAPIATRFPTGGLGLVIGASTAIFSVYYIGLIAGETLAERGHVPPFVAMWAANAAFLALGVFLYRRMGRETSTTRGGAADEFAWRVGQFFRVRRIRDTSAAGGVE